MFEGEVSELDSSWGILILVLLLTITFLVSYSLQRWRIQIIHETFIAILIGIISGLIIHYSSNKSIQAVVTFDHRYFFNLLLPPIILHSGYDLQVSLFFRHLGSILVFAFVGTIISSVVIGVLVWLVVLTGLHSLKLTLMECLMFGSILSSTDPVTILAIFNQLRVDPTLYAIIFGESMLNDAVAIVLYSTLDRHRNDGMSVSMFIKGTWSFISVFVGSCFVGVAFAAMAALLFKHTDLNRYPSIESCLVLLLAYFTYLLSNGIQMSGIVSLLFCGIAMKHYMYNNLSVRSQRTTMYMFHVMANMSENFVFIYLGLTIFTKADELFRWGLIFFTLFFILIARASSVFPLAWMINSFTRARKIGIWKSIRSSIPFIGRGSSNALNDYFIADEADPAPVSNVISRPHQIMLWWAGLRGAIAFALSMDMKTPNAVEVRTTTLMVVILSILLLGGTTIAALKRLQIKMADDKDYSDSPAVAPGGPQLHELDETTPGDIAIPSPTTNHWFLSFDNKYLKPFLTNGMNTSGNRQYSFIYDNGDVPVEQHELSSNQQSLE